ncbi:EAL domain-containing protein [Methylomonas albis]|uniref:EAL domain-containing protein n=1 Tax=Methylomonas albis TaxID=1854563 RepID=A0ABR9D3X3_9GAMM|nr:EAL domain-containing protein [Methylomonas albis]MBD9357824.1 EAL domain-containing protein [Methylomonas albis]
MDTLKKTVGVLLPAMRISLALVLLSICLLFTAEMLGFMPDKSKFMLESRKQVSEALAIQFSTIAPDQDPRRIERMLNALIKRSPDILSAGIRLQSGQLVFQVNDHLQEWADYDSKKSTSTHLVVPIFRDSEKWGDIEFKFAPIAGESAADFFEHPSFKMAIFFLVVGFFIYLAFMLRTLKMLDPSAVIPGRVNAAFDTLAEGVIIIDEQEQIVLANNAFLQKIASPMAALMGKKASKLKWKSADDATSDTYLPWQTVLKTGKRSIGNHLKLVGPNDVNFKFVINASPILGGNEATQGVLITLDDITEIEERNTKLQTMVSKLEESQAQVKEQNKELHFLATRDSLTGCLNRRAFNELFEKAFADALQNNLELSCIMVDIDHFKLVNDNYGHATGDVIIKLLAEILTTNTRKIDLVGRYGGEEFCVVLPGLSVDEAITVAERIRLRIKSESVARYETGPWVTASLGVASIFDKPEDPSELNKFADEALYVAKESGRNRVVRWQLQNEFAEKVKSDAQPAENNQTATHTEMAEDDSKVSKLQLRVDELEQIASQISTELDYSKHYDQLTGLPNQVLFYDRVNQVIERGHRYSHLAAIFVIDIGMFGMINATLGREVGDKVLKEIADRLNVTFRKSDDISRLTLSRIGGDVFAVLIPELPNKEGVTWMVERLIGALGVPVEIDGNSIYITGHIGISLYPADANSVDVLINNAITAKTFCKKTSSETSFQFFDNQMQELSIKHLHLDKELRRAIQTQEWELFYQPKMDVATKAVVGVEALIRWRHPSKGLLAPFEFIDFAEQRGLIVTIGEWVIRTACHQLKQWEEMGFMNRKIAVNLSAVQLKQDDFVEKVLAIIAEYQIAPRQLELEVTETTLMNNFQSALTALKRLSSRGIAISIDDFGTGYSSLSYLKNLPVDNLKIDRSFIIDICDDENDQKIVKMLINIAHSMSMMVIAEGVETQNQFDILAEYGCDEIQGYLLSKPIPAEEIEKMFSKAGVRSSPTRLKG